MFIFFLQVKISINVQNLNTFFSKFENDKVIGEDIQF